MTECACESIHHFPSDVLPEYLMGSEGVSTGHAYGSVPSGQYRADWVGPICDECATTHMAPYAQGHPASPSAGSSSRSTT